MNKHLSHTEYKKRLKKIHPSLILVSTFTKITGRVIVKDEFGKLNVNARSLLRGSPPGLDTAVDKTSYVLNKFKSIHNNFYQYPSFKFTSSRMKLRIICPLHGEFEQHYSNHIIGRGCRGCKNLHPKELEGFRNEFIKNNPKLSNRIHILSYNNAHSVIVKNKDGICKVSGRWLLKGVIPSIQTAIDKTQYFINQALEVHGDRYTYSQTIYKNSRTKIKVACKIHGDFETIPQNHLSKAGGCPVCKKIVRAFIDNELKDIEELVNIPYYVYLIRLSSNDESFFKIGISNTPKNRFNKIAKSSKYSVEVLSLKHTNALMAVNIENRILKYIRSKNRTYIPKDRFNGFSECFK